MGRKATSGGVRPAGDRIEVRFTWQGVQVSPTLPLKPTAANLKHAARQREQIVAQIARGEFNFAEHFPDYKFLAKRQAQGAQTATTVKEWFEEWLRLSERHLEHSTLAIYKRHMLAYWLPVFGHLAPARVSNRMVLERLLELSKPSVDLATGKARKGLGRKTQNNILIPLRAVFEMICKPPSTLRNPVEGIENQKTQGAGPDPFAPEEVEVILAKIRELEGDEAADYFEFSFFAGLRPSEQIALLWADVDLRTGSILVHRTRVLAEDKARTKTHKRRMVELNHRASAVLQRQRARTQVKGAEVFRNPHTGKAYNDEQTQRRIWTQALRVAGVRHRPPKEARDTSVTLALMAGANPMWVAMQHGHSVQVMLRDYARWIPSADRGQNLAAVNASLGAPAKPQANGI